MRTFTASEKIEAPPSSVWKYISNVAAWPTWLPTVSRVEPIACREISIGAKFKVYQPRLMPAVWSVIELNPGRNFVWQSSGPGLTLWANHVITPGPHDTSMVRLEFQFSGSIAPLVALLAGPITRRYLATEAAALKRLSEANIREDWLG